MVRKLTKFFVVCSLRVGSRKFQVNVQDVLLFFSNAPGGVTKRQVVIL